MGLTINYRLATRTRKFTSILELVEKMRQLALDLPFEHVDDQITHLDKSKHRDKGYMSFDAPWDLPGNGRRIVPEDVVGFHVNPGPGCEWAFIGLSKLPDEIELEYRPTNDKKFVKKTTRREGSVTFHGTAFRYDKWLQWLEDNGLDAWESQNDEKFFEKRMVKVKPSGWKTSQFCKTQYASDPRCGGIANFLRCHVSLITLLERIAELPSMKVYIDDEGKYGASNYTDDWKVKNPVYYLHEPTYSIETLTKELGDYNELIAAHVGALKDALGKDGCGIEAPITSFPNFEHLEFKGSQTSENVNLFVNECAKLARATMDKDLLSPAE